MNGEGEKLDIQLFNLEGIKTALHITEIDTSHSEVKDLFDKQISKIDRDLAEGFSVYIDEQNLDGHAGVYTSIPGKARFVLTKIVLDGSAHRETLSGRYEIEGGEVAVRVDRPIKSPILNCSVFLNNHLVASRSNPFDWAAQHAERLLRQAVEAKGEDPSKLDATIKLERTPFPFVKKMLNDFSQSKLDREYTQQMFEKMAKIKGKTVVWNRDYAFKKPKQS